MIYPYDLQSTSLKHTDVCPCGFNPALLMKGLVPPFYDSIQTLWWASLAHQSVQKRLITSFGGISSVVDCASKKVTIVVVKRQRVGRAGTISFSDNMDLSQITMVISLLAWIAHVCSNNHVFF